MNIDEVMRVVSSEIDVPVVFGGEKVWIEHVEEDKNTATVRFLFNGTKERVKVEDLKLDGRTS